MRDVLGSETPRSCQVETFSLEDEEEEDELTWILFPSQPGFCSLPPRGVILTEGDRRRRWSADRRMDGRLPCFRSGWWKEEKRRLHLSPSFFF